MVYLRLLQSEKKLLSSLKTKNLQIQDDIYVPFAQVKLAIDHLDQKSKDQLTKILDEPNRLVYNRTVKQRQKVCLLISKPTDHPKRSNSSRR